MHAKRGIITGSSFARSLPVLGVTPARAMRRRQALKVAGKLRLLPRVEGQARAAQTGDPYDFSKCDQKFVGKWTNTGSRRRQPCPSNGDQTAIQAFITQHTDDLAVALASGPLPDFQGAWRPATPVSHRTRDAAGQRHR